MLVMLSEALRVLDSAQAKGVDWLVVDANRPIDVIQEEISHAALEAVTAAKDRDIPLLW